MNKFSVYRMGLQRKIKKGKEDKEWVNWGAREKKTVGCERVHLAKFITHIQQLLSQSSKY